MRKAIRIAIVVVALLGSIAATVETVQADGGGPNPTCDPTLSKCTV